MVADDGLWLKQYLRTEKEVLDTPGFYSRPTARWLDSQLVLFKEVNMPPTRYSLFETLLTKYPFLLCYKDTRSWRRAFLDITQHGRFASKNTNALLRQTLRLDRGKLFFAHIKTVTASDIRRSPKSKA